jgi:hypothetical protein
MLESSYYFHEKRERIRAQHDEKEHCRSRSRNVHLKRRARSDQGPPHGARSVVKLCGYLHVPAS